MGKTSKPGRKPINDKFSNLPISRQRRWQMRKAEKGLCILCGEKTVNNWHCLEHMVYMRDWQARRDGSKKKLNCMSRRLEGKRTK